MVSEKTDHVNNAPALLLVLDLTRSAYDGDQATTGVDVFSLRQLKPGFLPDTHFTKLSVFQYLYVVAKATTITVVAGIAAAVNVRKAIMAQTTSMVPKPKVFPLLLTFTSTRLARSWPRMLP